MNTQVDLLDTCLEDGEEEEDGEDEEDEEDDDEDEEVWPSRPHQKGHTAQVRSGSKFGGFSVTGSGSICHP